MTFWVAGAAVVGAGVNAYAANKGSKAQIKGANQATATEQAQFQQTRADQAPWRDRGNASGNMLANMLGLNVEGESTFDARGYLAANPDVAKDPYYRAHPYEHFQQFGAAEDRGGVGYTNPSFDGAAYLRANPDIAKDPRFAADPQRHYLEYGIKEGRTTGQPTGNQGQFGSLLRDFSARDLKNDIVYQNGLQFGLSEGQKSIDRSFAARGGVQSGAAAKALARFGNDYGNTKANEAWNRFNVNKQNTFNMLSGVAGTGQIATNQVAAAGQNMANNVAQNQMGIGNARASGYVGGANALTGALGQGVNWYQQYQAMQPQYGVAQQPGVTGWTSQG